MRLPSQSNHSPKYINLQDILYCMSCACLLAKTNPHVTRVLCQVPFFYFFNITQSVHDKSLRQSVRKNEPCKVIRSISFFFLRGFLSHFSSHLSLLWRHRAHVFGHFVKSHILLKFTSTTLRLNKKLLLETFIIM